MTGGSADVSIEYPTTAIVRGQPFNVKVTVRSTGGEVKSEGVFMDIQARESGNLRGNGRCDHCKQNVDAPIRIDRESFDQKITIGPAFVLGDNETRTFDGQITIPTQYQGTYQGSVNHAWEIRGRLEAFGNDPDSGYRTIMVK